MAAGGDDDSGRPGRTMLDIVREIGHIGGVAEPFRKDCTDLARRVHLLSHLLEEVQDFKGRSFSSSSAGAGFSSSSSAFLSLADLRRALDAAKNVLTLARSAREPVADSVGMKIVFQFQFVTWQLEKVLRGIPYDYFDISDEVREQVELVCAQLRRATERKGSLNSKLLTDISCLLSQRQGVDPQVLYRVRENLQTGDTGNLDNDFRQIVDTIAEVYGKSGQTMENRRSLLDQLTQCSLSDSCKTDETDSRSDNIPNTTTEAEAKKPDILMIPDDFRCPISLELMRDPVIVSTGQTYERSFIQRWIDCGNKTCPKTQQRLENLTLTPNYVLRSLIRQWCETNKIEQPSGLSGSRSRSGNGLNQEMSEERAIIDCLVRKLSSRSIDDQRNAASEIRLLAKRSTDNRILIAEAGAIPLLVKLLSIDDLRTQENAVTALLNLSIYENNKGLIMLAGAVPPIVEVLKRGSMEARENAAATLFCLSVIDENKITIGASGAIKALVELLERGSLRGKKDAATALFNLCIYQGNKTRAVRAGILDPLMQMLTDTSDSMVDEALTILSVLASHQEGKIAIAKANAIPVLIDLLRSGLPRNKENAASILLALCKKDTGNLACIGRLGAIVPLMEIARSGTERAKRKASALLEHLAKMKQM